MPPSTRHMAEIDLSEMFSPANLGDDVNKLLKTTEYDSGGPQIFREGGPA